MFVTNLSLSKIQCCKLRQHVAQSRLNFYFLQHILIFLLVLPLKLQLVPQQIWIQRCLLAVTMRSNVAIKKRRAGWWGHKIGRAWFLSWPVNLGIHQFALYKDLEDSHSLWHTSFVPSKQSANLEELSQKYNFSPRYLKRHWAYSTERTLPRKITRGGNSIKIDIGKSFDNSITID